MNIKDKKTKIMVMSAATLILTIASVIVICAYPHSDRKVQKEIQENTDREVMEYIDTYSEGSSMSAQEIEELKKDIITEVEESLKNGLIEDLMKQDREEMINSVRQMEERITKELEDHNEEELSTSISAIVEKNLIDGLEGSNKATNENITVLRSSYEQNIAELKNGYTRLGRDIENSKSEMGTLRKEMEELSENDGEYLVKNEELKLRLDNAAKEIASMEAYQKSLYTLTKSVESEMDEKIKAGVKAGEDRIKVSEGAYEEKIESIETEFDGRMDSLLGLCEDKIKGYVTDMEKKSEDMVSKARAQNSEEIAALKDQMSADKEAAGKSLEEMSGRLGIMDSDIGGIKGSVEEIRTGMEDIGKRFDDADSEISSIKDACENNNKWDISVSENILHIVHGGEDTAIPLSSLQPT